MKTASVENVDRGEVYIEKCVLDTGMNNESTICLDLITRGTDLSGEFLALLFTLNEYLLVSELTSLFMIIYTYIILENSIGHGDWESVISKIPTYNYRFYLLRSSTHLKYIGIVQSLQKLCRQLKIASMR